MIGEKPIARTKIAVVKIHADDQRLWEIASEDVMSYHAHWLGKRSYMCPGSDCPACFQHIGAKWIGMVLLYRLDDSHTITGRVMLELTESSYHRLRDAGEAMGEGLKPGLIFKAARSSRRHSMRFEVAGLVNRQNPTAGEKNMRVLCDAVATLYNLPSLAPNETIPTWSNRSTEKARAIIKQALGSLL